MRCKKLQFAMVAWLCVSLAAPPVMARGGRGGGAGGGGLRRRRIIQSSTFHEPRGLTAVGEPTGIATIRPVSSLSDETFRPSCCSLTPLGFPTPINSSRVAIATVDLPASLDSSLDALASLDLPTAVHTLTSFYWRASRRKSSRKWGRAASGWQHGFACWPTSLGK